MNIQPFLLTLQMAIVTTVILFAIGVPIAYWLYSSRFRMKLLVEAALTLPLILPPSVLGFYLLLAFTPANAFGSFIKSVFDLQLVFTFEGLIVASVIYSMPFMIQPLLAGLRTLPSTLAEASYSLGKGRAATLLRVLLPNIKASVITAGILTFTLTPLASLALC
jgi:molybdate transport system permease protein